MKTVTEAVRLAKEALGEGSSEEMAAYNATTFGLAVKPVIVRIILASFREKGALEQSKQRALDLTEQLKAIPPEKRKKRVPKVSASSDPSPTATPSDA